MILKSLSVQNLGAVEYFECDFEDGINVIKSRYTDEINCAIRLVFNHKQWGCPENPITNNRKKGIAKRQAPKSKLAVENM